MFLRKLESRLIHKNSQDSREPTTSRKNKKQTSYDPNRVSNSNNSILLKEKPGNGSKAGYHNLIFNDIKFQTELMNILKKPKSTDKKDRITLSNIDQQKLLYGDEQTKKDLLSIKAHGRNAIPATVSGGTQVKSKSLSSKKERLVNNVKDMLAHKKKTLKKQHDLETSLRLKNVLSGCVSVTMGTPPPIETTFLEDR